MHGLSATSEKFTRYTLSVLLLLVALHAFAGGIYGMAGAKDIPVDWLEQSPFKSYFIPSLILFVLIGTSCLAAFIAVLKHLYWAPAATLSCSIMLIIWIVVQVSVIGYVSPMQPIIAVTTIIILFFSLLYLQLQMPDDAVNRVQLSKYRICLNMTL
jgi:ABC-type Na+ efflux pump permease subunit